MKKSDWISVSEELPEVDTLVLVYSSAWMDSYTLAYYYEDDTWYGFESANNLNTPENWQYLEKP